jgi:hypothetical protein
MTRRHVVLVAAGVLSIATNGVAQITPLRGAFLGCIVQAVQAGNLVESIEVEDSPNKRSATLMCLDEPAESMFSAMELASEQTFDQHKNITRSSGPAIHCTKTTNARYLCVVHIEAADPFLDAIKR